MGGEGGPHRSSPAGWPGVEIVSIGDISGKVALITGASSGLGAHFAQVLAAAGGEVILGARRLERVDALAKHIGGSARALRLDVTSPESVAALADEIPSLDILVNNAGVVSQGPALDVAEAEWNHVIDTNLTGVFRVTRTAGNIMRRNGGGSIINIASILGLRQAGSVLPYAVSKAGVIHMTKLLALELARFGIRVNALAPGYFGTDLNDDFWDTEAGKAMIKRIPQRRLGALEDLDGPLLLLASDASRYMTGSIVEVDGGHLVSSL